MTLFNPILAACVLFPVTAVQHQLQLTDAAALKPAAEWEADMGHARRRRRASKAIPDKILKRTKSKLTASKLAATATAAEVQQLFAGCDFPDDSPIMQGLTDMPKVSTAPVKVQLFGLQNTGVSLLRAMLHEHFGNRIDIYGFDSDGEDEDNQRGFWKFANVMELHHQKRMQVEELGKDVALISIIRDPYAWLQAMRAHGDSGPLASCLSGDDWLTAACTHESPAGSLSPTKYPSLPTLWNKWVSSYQNATQFGFRRRIVITYEALFKSPENILRRLATFLGVSSSAGVKMPYGSSQVALDEMMTRSHMKLFEKSELQQACMRLDKSVLGVFGYPSFDCLSFMKDPDSTLEAAPGLGADAA